MRNLRNLRQVRNRLRRRPQEGEDGFDDDLDVDYLNKLLEESEAEQARSKGRHKKERGREADLVEYWKRIEPVDGESEESLGTDDFVDVEDLTFIDEPVIGEEVQGDVELGVWSKGSGLLANIKRKNHS